MEIILNALEKAVVQNLQKKVGEIKNALGYEIDMTSLTTIIKKVSSQKFFQIAPADYMPVRVGEGAWSSNLITYRDFAVGGNFEDGLVNLGGQNARTAGADAAVDSVTVPVKNWAKFLSWSLFDLKQAALSGNWDVVTAKEKARKKNWDLGIQRVAFLGLSSVSGVYGLLNQTDVNESVSTLITGKLSELSAANFSTFIYSIIEAYRSNCNRTAMPTHFIMPEGDYNGMAVPTNSTYPLKTKLEMLLDAFKTITMNPNFKILPCAYGDQTNNNLSKNMYVLLNYDDESLRMDIPVDYTATLANSINNFNFENIGYGQFTGVKAYRPLEMYYMSYPNS